jgi:hypothetical protein
MMTGAYRIALIRVRCLAHFEHANNNVGALDLVSAQAAIPPDGHENWRNALFQRIRAQHAA